MLEVLLRGVGKWSQPLDGVENGEQASASAAGIIHFNLIPHLVEIRFNPRVLTLLTPVFLKT